MKFSIIFKNLDSFCCSNIGSNLINYDIASTSLDRFVKLSRNNYNGIDIGDYRTVECDIVATNGIIHSVNKTLPNVFGAPIRGIEQWFFI